MMQNMPTRNALINGQNSNPPPYHKETLPNSNQHKETLPNNYCPLPTPEDIKKQEVNKLISEYNQIHNRKHAIESRMKELGFRPAQ